MKTLDEVKELAIELSRIAAERGCRTVVVALVGEAVEKDGAQSAAWFISHRGSLPELRGLSVELHEILERVAQRHSMG